jgi:hypothetical protein
MYQKTNTLYIIDDLDTTIKKKSERNTMGGIHFHM